MLRPKGYAEKSLMVPTYCKLLADFLGMYMLVLTVSLHCMTESKASPISTACSLARMTFDVILRPKIYTEESVMVPTYSKLLADFLGI